jgi:transposase
MAHARRGFDKAKDDNKEKAEYALGMFQKLYAIEQEAREKNLSPAERHALRLEKALPVLNELGKWMVETYKTSRPKSPIGKAVAYCIPRWDNLLNYLEDGSLEIDNNLAENAIRPIALGRKNYSSVPKKISRRPTTPPITERTTASKINSSRMKYFFAPSDF